MRRDQRVAAALRLLEALSAAPGKTLSRAAAAAAVPCQDADLEELARLISTLADRETGARAIIDCTEDSLSIMGESTELLPLRLDVSEGTALAHVLGALHIDPNAAERIGRALLPAGFSATVAEGSIATTVSYGSCYQTLAEAAVDGVRCRILYRAHDDASPAPRLVDPCTIDTTGGAAYLVAWNVEKDRERRYRLDRITGVELTDDSVEAHPWSASPLEESLRRSGTPVTLECSAERAAQLTWAGITSVQNVSDTPGRARVDLHASSASWLFDQVLSAAGDMQIIAPAEARTALRAYASALLLED